MKKIIILGINYLTLKIEKLIDNNKCKIVAFISDNPNNKGKYLNNIPVISLDEALTYFYDFIIVTNEVKPDKRLHDVLNLYEYINIFYDFEIYRAFFNLKNSFKNLEAFITGISYLEVGIDASKLPFNTVNMAVSSQDLFYDYEIAKFILNSKKQENHIKYSFIGLAYYSFDYDLSKSSAGSRSYFYYPFLKTLHNYKDKHSLCTEFNVFDKIIQGLFKNDYKTILFDLLRSTPESNWANFVNGSLNEDKIKSGHDLAMRNFNKNYPLTEKENILIFKNYIKLLKSNNITPIVVIAPTTEHYYKFLPKKLEDRFNFILGNIQKTENIKVLNYFRSNNYDNTDFYDVSHLNTKGTNKFTDALISNL
ncbi:nucleoside-diphosphate sugar epimerase/dehydratase [Clostridium felsineum]|uniref:nucleoside-diphosphate sugar epimerase/dehydratase n=1 Tax=Clostridium felsineum TaxID=36839 RepID=UPI00098CD9E7|nr:D-alanyl-lipoteichoic acid biosynthesis protein DltD [Clostridium felsineum]URZ03280.1 hypothetical protein CLAUR_033260 [Clostridium felsineum]